MIKNKIADFIQGIIKKCSGERHIFRGENMKYPRPVSSGLYRQFCLQGKGKNAQPPITSEHFSVVSVEEDRLNKARRHFPPGAENIDILTGLRHYGGDTALIDFSRNLHIALYFACEGNYKNEGYLYLYKESQFGEPIGKIEYEDGDKNKDRLVVPTDKNARVVFQSSVFVHSYRGFLEAKEDDFVKIPKDYKNEILNYLKNYFSINSETVYNDIHGFIENQNSYTTAEIEFYRGIAKFNEGDKKGAIDYYNKSITLNPRSYQAYNNRGIIKAQEGDLAGAEIDFNEAIEQDSKDFKAYFNRGNIKGQKSDWGGALVDFDEAIKLNPQDANVYHNRGIAKKELGDEKGAEEDFRKEQELREKKKKE